MPFYETIFETGSKAVAEYADDKEALSAAGAHHERATKGEPGRGKSTPRNDLGDDAPQVMDYPAERVVKILKYDEHPANYMSDATMSTDVFTSEVKNIIKKLDQSGVIDLREVEAEVRELSSSVVPSPGVHDSMYKMKETKELTL